MRRIWSGDWVDRGLGDLEMGRLGDGETWGLGDVEVGEIFYELFSIILLNFKNLYDLYGLI